MAPSMSPVMEGEGVLEQEWAVGPLLLSQREALAPQCFGPPKCVWVPQLNVRHGGGF